MIRYIILIPLILASIPVYSQQNAILNGSHEALYPIKADTSTYESLTPLTNLFQSKEIVGMGEATHGTHEFFDTKIKTFQFLVTKCNYRVFGIEASYGAQMYVNDYVKYGIGNIQDAMKYLDWPWGTEEVRELVEWIKYYNLDKDENDKISFYGFDMQNITFSIKYIQHFLLNDSSDYSDKFRKITPLLCNKSETEVFQLILKEEQIFKDSLYTIDNCLQDWINIYATEISVKYGEKEFERIKLGIENFHQSFNNIFGGNQCISFRDSCMAYNVLKIQKLENRKMFIWAHNGHIGLESQGIPIMGTYLKRLLKEKYYAIGFAFDHGNFMAFKGPNTIAGAFFKFIFNKKKLYQGLVECTAVTNNKNTLTNELKKTNWDSFFIDLNSTHNTMFITPQYYYDIGATYLNNRHASSKIIAKDEFDGLFFFNSTTATKVLKN